MTANCSAECPTPHTRRTSLAFFSSLLFSSLAFLSCLVFSCLVSLSLSLSVSVSVLCYVVCVVVVVVSLWSWCVWCVCVYCGTVKKREKKVCVYKTLSVCRFKTSPCVPAPSPHVWAWCQYTRKAFWMDTRGRRGGHRQFCLSKIAHVELSRASEVHRKQPLDVTHL